MLYNIRTALFQLQEAFDGAFPGPEKGFEVSNMRNSRISGTLPIVLLHSCSVPESMT